MTVLSFQARMMHMIVNKNSKLSDRNGSFIYFLKKTKLFQLLRINHHVQGFFGQLRGYIHIVIFIIRNRLSIEQRD